MTVPGDRLPIENNPGFYTRNGVVEFRFRDKKGKRRWRRARTLAEAKRLRAQLQTDVDRGEYREASRITVRQYGAKWIQTYQGRTREPIREHSRANLERRLREAYEFFGDMRMAEVEPQDIKAFAAHVAGRGRRGATRASTKPLAANTIRLTLAPVKAMFATAFEEGVIRVNPAAGVRVAVPRRRLLDDEEGEVKALTEKELQAVLAAIAARSPDRLMFFRVLVALGLRISEAIELRWADVDFGKRTVRVRRVCYDGKVGPPKSKYGKRTLRLTPELGQALWRARGTGRDEELVFANGHGGWIDKSNLMSRVLKPAAADAGVGRWLEATPTRARKAESWVGFHTFRHTCATLLFTSAKWNPKQVQLWLGHHSAAFTVDTYVHLLPEDLPEPPVLGGVFGTTPGTTSTGNGRKSTVEVLDVDDVAIAAFAGRT